MNQESLADIEQIFHPRAIAVVGASNRVGNFGRFFIESLLEAGFERLYVVHPREEDVLGKKVYTSVKEIPDKVDLAVVTTPPEAVRQIISECTEKGVKGVIIYTSGFGEQSSEGKKMEQELVSIAHRGDTRLIGPNCMGIYCPSSRVSNFTGLSKESGGVAMISHSGSLSAMLPMAAMAQGIRFSKVVSCGNECDLNAVDFLEYFGADTETEIIIAYLEAIKEGRRFCQIARDISRKKPIIIWKGGKTEWGVKAAASHTGALAGSSKVFNAALTQTGVISANSAEELLDILQAFHYLPLPKGRRVAIITGPGGPAVGTSDACVEVSLEIAQLSQQSKDRITKLLPSIGTSTDNPVDMGMATMFFPQWYIESIKVLADDEGVDMLLVIGASLTPDFGKLAAETALASGKPLALATVPGLTGEQILPTRGLAIFSDGRRAAIALGKLVEYQQFLGSI